MSIDTKRPAVAEQQRNFSYTYVNGLWEQIDAQAAEIAALRQPWQPIETAPKDGVRYIGAYEYHGIWFAEIVGDHSVASIIGNAIPATHWMPLPAPPADLSGESNV